MKIIEYNRPDQLEQALTLLQRQSPRTLPLGGGTWLNQPGEEPVAVVDLQGLSLDQVQRQGQSLHLGAALRLQSLLEQVDSSGLGLPAALGAAIRHEATYNLRQAATIAGTLVAASGKSPFTTALLALEAVLHLLPGDQDLGLGDLLPLREERLRGRLITRVTIPLQARLAYEYVARTPADQPIVCAALAAWPSGRVRLALGGFGAAPLLAFDGTESGGIEIAAQSAYSQAGDSLASAGYRREMAGVLALKCLEQLQG
jgi:putative selenate reductase FAD-binding subunit